MENLCRSESSAIIYHANAEDVIYGRGNHLKKHPGNKHYRSLIQAVREYYEMFPKDKKRIVCKLVYETIQGQRPPGRFLTEIQSGQYVELDIEVALRKISQCLREKHNKIIKVSPGRLKTISEIDPYGKIEEIRVRISWKRNTHFS
jgi:hypothetical protein